MAVRAAVWLAATMTACPVAVESLMSAAVGRQSDFMAVVAAPDPPRARDDVPAPMMLRTDAPLTAVTMDCPVAVASTMSAMCRVPNVGGFAVR
jgi:hypothetical protein